MDVLRDALGEGAWNGAERLDEPDPDGWWHLLVRLDWPDEAPRRLLWLGDGAEVLEPLELRDQLIDAARSVLERYAGTPRPIGS